MKKTLYTTLIILLFSAVGIAGNSKTTSFKGQVTDEKGKPVIGAKVTIEASDSYVYTDFDGMFVFNSVPKTNQTVKVSMISFEEKESTVNLSESSLNKTIPIILESKKL